MSVTSNLFGRGMLCLGSSRPAVLCFVDCEALPHKLEGGKLSISISSIVCFSLLRLSMLRRNMSTLSSNLFRWGGSHGSSKSSSSSSSPRHALTRTAWKSSASSIFANEVVVSSYFKPWKVPVVESHGDYRAEAWLEEHIGGPLYAEQASLPRFPVPSLENTVQRFLPTALPLARSEQEAVALQKATAKFPLQAQPLHERLLQRAKDNPDSSWLQLFWNQLGYLQVRDPVIINVSYFFHFSDDHTVATDDNAQIQRAAAMLVAAGQFRKRTCSGELPPERIGKGDRAKTLCSVAYKYMFHACRIPLETQDSYKIYDPARHHHAVVACQGHFFAVDLCHPGTAEPYSVYALEKALRECQQRAKAMGSMKECPNLQLGWLTSSHRDDWARARQALLQQGGPELQNALEMLESGSVLVCLDDDVVVSRAECAEKLLHGTVTHGGNRWFDKSIQLICSRNGKAGLLGEHSMMDGMPVVSLADHITKTTYREACQLSSSASNDSCRVQTIFPPCLQQKIQGAAEPLVAKAKQDFTTFTTNNALHVQSFQGYGSTFIKQAGYSPDAFVQVAMQLATYRLWGEQVGTYEATQVRPFLHGRTETTRAVSMESAQFVRRMGLRPALDEHDAAVRKEKLQMLQDAVAAHVKYIGLAAQAQGVDRHFFGLSMMVQEGETTPDLYGDAVFARAKRWRVSTSHLTHPKFDGWGYGQVVPDGVGLAYSIHPRHCVFNITALKATGWTDKLSELLEEALLEIRTLVEMEALQKPTSKL